MCNQVAHGLKYDHVLIALMDDNPYLSDGSKQVQEATSPLHVAQTVSVIGFIAPRRRQHLYAADSALTAQVLATTASLASVNKSKVTVLLVDGKPSTGEGNSWIEAASWYFSVSLTNSSIFSCANTAINSGCCSCHRNQSILIARASPTVLPVQSQRCNGVARTMHSIIVPLRLRIRHRLRGSSVI